MVPLPDMAKSDSVLRWRCPQHDVRLTWGSESDVPPLTCPMGCAFEYNNGVLDFLRSSGYAESFGLQWHAFAETQLDSRNGTTISRERLMQSLGALWDEIGPESQVLEVGCGAGRFSEILADRGCRLVSLDLSSAVWVCATNLSQATNVTFVRADARHIPFEPGQFDVVIALGMLQHTPDPVVTLQSLAEVIRGGGSIVVDQYERHPKHILRLKAIVRLAVINLPISRRQRVSDGLYRAFAPLHRRFGRGVAKGLLSIVSPIVYFDEEYPSLSAKQREEWGRLDTHDSLTDRYQYRTSPKLLQRRLLKAGFGNVVVWKSRQGVTARGDLLDGSHREAR